MNQVMSLVFGSIIGVTALLGFGLFQGSGPCQFLLICESKELQENKKLFKEIEQLKLENARIRKQMEESLVTSEANVEEQRKQLNESLALLKTVNEIVKEGESNEELQIRVAQKLREIARFIRCVDGGKKQCLS